MPTFDELQQRYMVSQISGGSLGSGGATIPIRSNCDVLPLIQGRTYFPALKAAINSLSGSESFVYITGWWCDSTFSLDGPGGPSLVNLLKAKAQAGVDVRVLGWVLAPEVLTSRLLRTALSSGHLPPALQDMLTLNDDTIQFINALRAEPTLANKACLNILSHPGGAAHMKFALVGNSTQATGFTGGLDLHPGRWETSWYDVQAQVKGPVLQDFFTTFQQLWNEIKGRSVQRLTGLTQSADTHSGSTPTLPTRTLATGSGGTSHVQNLRTLPKFDFSLLASAVVPTNDPLSFAPNGLFQIKTAWEKAIGGAQRYIYIEDQGFTSTTVMDWINAAVKANGELRVVLLTGRADPNDRPNSAMTKAFRIAINDHLLKGIPAGSPLLNRIGVFSHQTSVIHSKMTLIDDQWALIGSANCMRRSLFTDIEHSVAYMDEAGQAVANQRAQLWQPHLGSLISGIDPALAAWFALPFLGATGATGSIKRLRLPLPPAALTSDEQILYDEVLDADSRQTWGAGLARMLASQASGSILS